MKTKRKKIWGKLFEKVAKKKTQKEVNKKIVYLDSTGKIINEKKV